MKRMLLMVVVLGLIRPVVAGEVENPSTHNAGMNAGRLYWAVTACGGRLTKRALNVIVALKTDGGPNFERAVQDGIVDYAEAALTHGQVAACLSVLNRFGPTGNGIANMYLPLSE